MGGVFVIWIAVRVLSDASAPPPVPDARGSLLDAVWLIVVADITMSTDNVLAVAGAARGNVPLIIFGLCVSIPFVIFSSDLIARLMDRYPAVLYFGAAVLGRVGAEMIFTDGLVVRTLHPSETLIYVAEGISILGVLAIGRFLSLRARAKSGVAVEALHGQ
jgi:predicted tellurium resistance membrane protein TerC